MTALGAIGFLSPSLLIALAALPLLWWLLRAVPPAAIKRRFPAVSLLLGLKDPESTPVKTPWWLLALRMTALAAIIIGFAEPVLNPEPASRSTHPLLILEDASWASASDWGARKARVRAALKRAGASARPVAILSLSAPRERRLESGANLPFQPARAWLDRLPAMAPNPWEPDYDTFRKWLESQPAQRFDTLWLSDRLARKGRLSLTRDLLARGRLSVVQGRGPIGALLPAERVGGKITVPVLRLPNILPKTVTLTAYGPDPAGIIRPLGRTSGRFAKGASRLNLALDLPLDLQNRITWFRLGNTRSAGAVLLSDDTLQRRKVALFSAQRAREEQELLSPLHYLEKALQPTAEVIKAPMRAALNANPDVIILADIAHLTGAEAGLLEKWVRAGGLLVRFAGPRLAANSLQQNQGDPLLPVRLRAGGRTIGGAMSWGAPRHLQAFRRDTPFHGLTVPADVNVSTQVLAQPDPELSQRTIAALQDGTPLVTEKTLGKGRVVLFHVTASAEWSTLPLSGLFVKMLERLSVSTGGSASRTNADLIGQNWQPRRLIDAFGAFTSGKDRPVVTGRILTAGRLGPELRPGLYVNGPRHVALNVLKAGRRLDPAQWPAGVTLLPMTQTREQPLEPLFLLAGLMALLVDILATLWIGGRLWGSRAGVMSALAVLAILPGQQARADDALALRATQNTVLAYVITGDARLDRESEAGLYGLSQILAQRTAVEPADPIGVNLEKDELAFFPLIYWPISARQKTPSEAAYRRLNTYLAKGGLILFDTRDANLAGTGQPPGANGRRLQELAARLDIPPLEPIPSDHVLTRSFYLLQDFPGRYAQSDVWVEAAPPNATQTKGVPFRNLNDGVSPVVIGGNDWAAAWALSRAGQPLYPVGRGGYAGERQREMAYRFGVNLVMYVLTGNYKSDQVHVPALLQRLGQ